MSAALQLSDEDVRGGTRLGRAAARHERKRRKSARDCGHFIEYAIYHEETNEPVKNCDFHWEWQKICDEQPLAVIMASVEHAKTSQIAVGRTLYTLGRNPNARLALISNSATAAEKILKSVSKHIEKNERVHEVFPDLVPSEDREEPWNKSMITVKRDTISKDPSVQAMGVGGPIVGSRLDGAILDDVLDFDNTYTHEQRKKLIEWFESTLMTRIVDGGFCWVIGTPWHPEDLLHFLKKMPDWHFSSWPAMHNPEDKPEEWRSRWFRPERLQKIYRNTTPKNFNRKYRLVVSSDKTSRFQKSWIKLCLANGRGWKMYTRAPRAPSGELYPCFTGVDLGVGQGEGHDLSVLFTIALDPAQRRIVADIQSGRWLGPEIIRRMADVYMRFGSIIIVENVAAQEYLRQFAGDAGIATVPFTTTRSAKNDEAFGIETIATEFRSGLWIIPSPDGEHGEIEEIDEWLAGCRNYEPTSHPNDYLMASWFAQRFARKSSAQTIIEGVDMQYR